MSLLQRRLRNQVPDTFSLRNGVWILTRKRKPEEQLGHRRGLPSPPSLEMLGGSWADVRVGFPLGFTLHENSIFQQHMPDGLCWEGW